MNRVELFIYNLVKDNPLLKQRIVDVYQKVLGFIPQSKLVTEYPIIERSGFFYGFHDKCPFSRDGNLLLAHRNVIGDRLVKAGDKVDVGFFTGANWDDYHLLGSTDAWNWQLGSMLQWLGSSNGKVAYNILDSGRPVARIQDIDGTAKDQWDYPVVHVSPDGANFCTYDFSRVEAGLPGYGVVLDFAELGSHKSSYFRVVSCLDGSVVFQISLAEAESMQHHPSMDGAFHFFHHALFNPTSDRLFFMHRWLDKNGRYWTRMFSVGADGSNLYLFPMNEMVSHVTWASPTEIFSYLRYPDCGDGYYLVEDQTGEAIRLFENVLNSDGHPTIDLERGIVITDTYPDRFRNQYLVLGKVDGQERINLCRTHLPAIFRRELQVDLHPRLHPNLNVACVDSGHSGTRSLLTVDFSQALQ